jgi:putative hemolysin
MMSILAGATHAHLQSGPIPMPDHRISILELLPQQKRSARWLSFAGLSVDRLLGIATIDGLYQRGKLATLPPLEFSSASLGVLGVKVAPVRTLVDAGMPAVGPVLIVCNHPFGAVEALVLADALRGVRCDVRFLANAGLRVFRELDPLLIATDPLRVTQQNISSIRACDAHLEAGGVLVLFPAGRVSSFVADRGRITDFAWNRLVGRLALATGATILPVYFHGRNSRAFHVFGRIWDRLKLLMLPRELLRLRGRTVSYCAGRPLPPALWRHMDVPALTRFARLLTYSQAEVAAPGRDDGQSARSVRAPAPLAPRGDGLAMARELEALPGRQRLLEFRQFSVAYASAAQIPQLMAEIGRERERVFRTLDEGSGSPADTDGFDRSYVQLFVWDRVAHELVGAYRMGRTDRLLAEAGPDGLYLSRVFEFSSGFHDPVRPALELGRSFIVPEHQRSFHGLYLLWQGIGRYLLGHPEYRRLYGTVSLSRQYDPQVIAMLCDALIQPSPLVRARLPVTTPLRAEWQDYRRAAGGLDIATLGAIVRGLDGQGKDIPVLLRHYIKLGAKFHAVGVDPGFNATPGLLLSVDVPSLERKTLATFLGAAAVQYLAYSPSPSSDRLSHSREYECPSTQ